MTTKKYKIIIKTLSEHILTYTVENYTITEGDFITFTDLKTGQVKKYHASRCEILEAEQ